MKLTFLLFIVLIHVGCATTSYTTTSSLTQHITALEDQWLTALVKKDTATMATILAPDFILNGSNPVNETRSQYLATSAMPERILQPLVLKDRQYQLYQNTVISTGSTEYAGKWKENQFALPVRYTHVFVKTANQWRVASAHLSVIR